MNELAESLISYAHNLSLLLAFVFAYGLLLRHSRSWQPAQRQLSFGVLFGLAANLAMLMPVQVNPDVIIDNRIAVVALIAPFVAWPAVIPGVLLACLGRYALGGLGVWPGIACLISAGLLSVAVAHFRSINKGNLSWLSLLVIGIIIPIITLPWTFTLPAPVDALAVFRHIALPVSIISPIGCLVLGGLLLYVHHVDFLSQGVNQNERRFRSLFEGAADAIIIANPDAGVVVDANDKACQLLRRSHEEILGMHQSELHPPSDVERYKAIFEDHLLSLQQGDTPEPIEMEFITSDDQRIPVEGTASMFRYADEAFIVGFFRDISDKKHTEAALARSEARTRSIAETAPVMILIIDDSGTILQSNPYAEQLLGWTTIELRQTNWFELLDHNAGDEQKWEQFFQQQEQRDSDQFVASLYDRQKTEHVMSWSLSMMPQAGGRRQLMAIGIDITDVQRLEQELRQSEKLQAIGQLAGGIAHDFNNQLQIIQGFATMLDDDSASGKQHECLQVIIQAAERSADLASKLLAFSRKGSIARRPIAMDSLIENSCSMIRHTIDRRIELVQQVHDQSMTVTGDEHSLQSVLLNLYINARDAMPDGGLLSISANRCHFDSDTAINSIALPAGDYCQLQVRDTGGGISDEIRSSIFEPFFTTKPLGQGTGLGLSAVYGSVRSHGGAVDVDSKPGAGTCFTIYLPLAPEQTKDASAHASSGRQVVPGVNSVMIIDDEKFVLTVLKGGLASHGVEARCFLNGREALAWIKQTESLPDVVVVDLNMPDMHGSELVEAIDQQVPGLPVLVSTGLGKAGVPEYLLQRSRTDVICKPFKPDDLFRRINKLIIAI